MFRPFAAGDPGSGNDPIVHDHYGRRRSGPLREMPGAKEGCGFCGDSRVIDPDGTGGRWRDG